MMLRLRSRRPDVEGRGPSLTTRMSLDSMG